MLAAGIVELGGLQLAGDYLQLTATNITFAGPIAAPSNLFVHFQPSAASASVGIEGAPSTAQRGRGPGIPRDTNSRQG